MEWTPEQEQALAAVAGWLRSKRRKPFFYLGGYAGTGKTTLARHFAEGVAGTVMFGAYTGKAAHVMQGKGCVGATTIHSMIYVPKGSGSARLHEIELQLARHVSGERVLPDAEIDALQQALEEERDIADQPSFGLNGDAPAKYASLLVLDECSMINKEIGEDLLSFGVPILVLGDPAQLPPVRGGGYFTSHRPDALLVDVRRQAKESPIIEMATRVRQGKGLSLGTYGTSKVVERPDREEALSADQILVGRNATRNQYNRHIRNCFGRTELVEPGDKIVCLRNSHEIGLLNGSIWWVSKVTDHEDLFELTIFNEEGRALDVWAHTDTFRNGEPAKGMYFERQHAEEFCHAGALTVHKAQGSQWNDVLVVNESGCFRGSEKQWLYTAITRAAEKVIVVQ